MSKPTKAKLAAMARDVLRDSCATVEGALRGMRFAVANLAEAQEAEPEKAADVDITKPRRNSHALRLAADAVQERKHAIGGLAINAEQRGDDAVFWRRVADQLQRVEDELNEDAARAPEPTTAPRYPEDLVGELLDMMAKIPVDKTVISYALLQAITLADKLRKAGAR
jgi:hypothetical protein